MTILKAALNPTNSEVSRTHKHCTSLLSWIITLFIQCVYTVCLVKDVPFIDTALPGSVVEASWNVMTPAQKPDFFFRRNGRVHLNRRGRQFSRLLAAEVCASAVVLLDTPCSEVVWRVLATYSINQFPLQFPSRASPCSITFQLDSTDTSFSKCCEIYVHHSPRDGRFTVIAIKATAWGHAFREGPEKSGFISEFTSSIFLRKFCRGPGTIPCGIFGGKKKALTRISARVLGCTLSLWFHECSKRTFHSTTLLYF